MARYDPPLSAAEMKTAKEVVCRRLNTSIKKTGEKLYVDPSPTRFSSTSLVLSRNMFERFREIHREASQERYPRIGIRDAERGYILTPVSRKVERFDRIRNLKINGFQGIIDVRTRLETKTNPTKKGAWVIDHGGKFHFIILE